MVNKVKRGGSGTSNDGNKTRSFSKNYWQSARITGVNESLILIFCVILQIISSGFKLNIEKFNKYKDTQLNYLLKNNHGFTCQPVVIKYWSMLLILFLGPFCLPGNCPRMHRNLETRIRTELISVLILHASCQQNFMTYTIAVCKVKTPDDGERNCSKHVDFYSKQKFEKLVRLVGFITRSSFFIFCGPVTVFCAGENYTRLWVEFSRIVLILKQQLRLLSLSFNNKM